MVCLVLQCIPYKIGTTEMYTNVFVMEHGVDCLLFLGTE